MTYIERQGRPAYIPRHPLPAEFISPIRESLHCAAEVSKNRPTTREVHSYLTRRLNSLVIKAQSDLAQLGQKAIWAPHSRWVKECPLDFETLDSTPVVAEVSHAGRRVTIAWDVTSNNTTSERLLALTFGVGGPAGDRHYVGRVEHGLLTTEPRYVSEPAGEPSTFASASFGRFSAYRFAEFISDQLDHILTTGDDVVSRYAEHAVTGTTPQ